MRLCRSHELPTLDLKAALRPLEGGGSKVPAMDTFVVRVHRPGQIPPDDDRLRGVVDEISTGAHATFHDAGELLAILRRPHPLPTKGGADEPGQRQTR